MGSGTPTAYNLIMSDEYKAGRAIYYWAGDCGVSMKRELTHPVSDVAGSLICTHLFIRAITRSFWPFSAIRSVSAVDDGAVRTLTELES